MQSVSPHDPGTTPDNRSLTDLWRDLAAAPWNWEHHPSRGPEWDAAWDAFEERLQQIADQRNRAAIQEHAQVEHPELAWDAQAAVFTTGRFAEGRAR